MTACGEKIKVGTGEEAGKKLIQDLDSLLTEASTNTPQHMLNEHFVNLKRIPMLLTRTSISEGGDVLDPDFCVCVF